MNVENDESVTRALLLKTSDLSRPLTVICKDVLHLEMNMYILTNTDGKKKRITRRSKTKAGSVIQWVF